MTRSIALLGAVVGVAMLLAAGAAGAGGETGRHDSSSVMSGEPILVAQLGGTSVSTRRPASAVTEVSLKNLQSELTNICAHSAGLTRMATDTTPTQEPASMRPQFEVDHVLSSMGYKFSESVRITVATPSANGVVSLAPYKSTYDSGMQGIGVHNYDAYLYQPNAGYEGLDSVTFRVEFDGHTVDVSYTIWVEKWLTTEDCDEGLKELKARLRSRPGSSIGSVKD